MSLYDRLHETLYEAYRVQWMLTHGFGLSSLLNELDDLVKENEDANITPKMAFQEFEDIGFNGQLWVCFDEFMQNEYQDRTYIENLINTIPFSNYWYLIYQEEKTELLRAPEDYYEKDDAEPLNFIECMQLLDTLVVNEVLMRDKENPSNIIVFHEAGDENHPEGCYSRNIHEVSRELMNNLDDQRFLRDTLKEKGISLKLVKYMF